VAELRPGESRRRDADDRIGLVAKRHGPAQDVLGGPEPVAPGTVAQHDHLPGAGGAVLVFGEETTDARLRAEQRKERRRAIAQANWARAVPAADQGIVDGVGCQAVERSGPFREHGVRDVPERRVAARRLAIPLNGGLEVDDAGGVTDVGRAAEEHPVGHAEQGAVGANPERQRSADEEGKSGLPAQAARGKPAITDE